MSNRFCLTLLLLACLSLMAGRAGAQTTLLTNLELYAKYDNDVLDASGNGRNGTWQGTAAYTTGIIDNCIFPDGALRYVNHGTGVPIASVSKFSASVWFRPSSLSAYRCIYLEGGSADSSRTVLTLGGSGMGDSSCLGATVANGSNSYGYTSTGKIATGNWYHAVVVFDGTLSGNANRLKIYLNGTQETLTFNGTIPATTANTTTDSFFTGSITGSFVWDGRIDELGIWSRDLTSTEAGQLYNSGAGLPYSSFGGGGGGGTKPLLKFYYLKACGYANRQQRQQEHIEKYGVYSIAI